MLTNDVASLHLLVQIHAREPAHFYRMMECIAHNAGYGFVRQISVFREGSAETGCIPKVTYYDIRDRLTFGELLEQGVPLTQAGISHIGIVNADIFLSDDIAPILWRLTKRTSVIALTRKEGDGRFLHDPKCSQDAWIFRNHSFPNHLYQRIHAYPGIAGCEQIFAMGLFCDGYEIWNPCLDCVITHNDPSPKTEWPERHYGAYLLIPPCKIQDIETARMPYEVVLCRRNGSL